MKRIGSGIGLLAAMLLAAPQIERQATPQEVEALRVEPTPTTATAPRQAQNPLGKGINDILARITLGWEDERRRGRVALNRTLKSKRRYNRRQHRATLNNWV